MFLTLCDKFADTNPPCRCLIIIFAIGATFSAIRLPHSAGYVQLPRHTRARAPGSDCSHTLWRTQPQQASKPHSALLRCRPVPSTGIHGRLVRGPHPDAFHVSLSPIGGPYVFRPERSTDVATYPRRVGRPTQVHYAPRRRGSCLRHCQGALARRQRARVCARSRGQ